MERVLRAMDVIPPFDDDNTLDTPAGKSPKKSASTKSQAGKVPKRSVAKAQDGPPNADNGVPTLDLGEKILAEQRRVTAGRRRAPGGVQTSQDHLRTTPAPPKIPHGRTPTEELAQLQLIVADIVARDIERLCAGPRRAFG